MTQIFAVFTAESASWYFPGVSFFSAAILTLLCLLIFVPVVTRHRLTEPGKA